MSEVSEWRRRSPYNGEDFVAGLKRMTPEERDEALKPVRKYLHELSEAADRALEEKGRAEYIKLFGVDNVRKVEFRWDNQYNDWGETDIAQVYLNLEGTRENYLWALNKIIYDRDRASTFGMCGFHWLNEDDDDD